MSQKTVSSIYRFITLIIFSTYFVTHTRITVGSSWAFTGNAPWAEAYIQGENERQTHISGLI